MAKCKVEKKNSKELQKKDKRQREERRKEESKRGAEREDRESKDSLDYCESTSHLHTLLPNQALTGHLSHLYLSTCLTDPARSNPTGLATPTLHLYQRAKFL